MTGLFGDDYFETVAEATKAAGLVGSLVHTGGGVMVYHLEGRSNVTVGIDRESVVGYVKDEEDPDLIFWLPAGTTMADIVEAAQKMMAAAEEKHAG